MQAVHRNVFNRLVIPKAIAVLRQADRFDRQGKRILSEQDLEQVVFIPPRPQSLVLDAEFCRRLLSQ